MTSDHAEPIKSRSQTAGWTRAQVTKKLLISRQAFGKFDSREGLSWTLDWRNLKGFSRTPAANSPTTRMMGSGSEQSDHRRASQEGTQVARMVAGRFGRPCGAERCDRRGFRTRSASERTHVNGLQRALESGFQTASW